jgi:hypothetical protein
LSPCHFVIEVADGDEAGSVEIRASDAIVEEDGLVLTTAPKHHRLRIRWAALEANIQFAGFSDGPVKLFVMPVSCLLVLRRR